MLGVFSVINLEKEIDAKCLPNSSQLKYFVYDGNYFSMSHINKFGNDKFLFEDDNFVVLFDGVITNDKDIKKKMEVSSMGIAIEKSVEQGELGKFLNSLRGSFAGVVYEKKNRISHFFVDHWSSKPLFYMQIGENLVVSSEINAIVDYCKIVGATIELNMAGAYSLLSYAYMYGNMTIIEGIKRINPGTILTYQNNVITFSCFHKWSFCENDISEEEAIDKIDELFKQAMYRQLNKNREYGYKDVIPLSAGLDCRMTSFVASEISDNAVVNFSYSQSGQQDAVIPAKMASVLGNQWIFKNLDNGLDLFNIEDSIHLADGMIYYPWVSQLNTFLNMVNTNEWGIVHTGVIGDVIIGSFNKSLNDIKRKYEIGDGAYSQKLIPKMLKLIEIEEQSYEEGMMRNRAINGACMGYSSSFRQICESMSPFMDIDFAEFCFSLPQQYRVQHYIYYKWVLKKHADAAKFPHNGVRISNKPQIEIRGKRYHIDTIGDLIKNKIMSKKNKQFGMNPFDFWYSNNPRLKEYLDNYYIENRYVIENYKYLYDDVTDLYEKGNAVEKTMVISLLGTVKWLFEGKA